MQFQILSHASLLISTARASIIIDPWLVGTCYWRSWWHFPPARFDEDQVRSVDAVVLSHIHWDHWHGPTLKKFLQGKPVYIPDEPGLRSERDLRSIGFTDVHRVAHGKTVQVGDIKLTLYQFGLYINDAAIVVEADGVCLLNANDAKIAGWPLRHLLSRHGPIDFAFRSHSSANPRACFKIEGAGHLEPDDQDQYFKAFSAFMDAVQPRYAVPFASNHCHLHDDVVEFNASIANPLQLRDFVTRRGNSASGWKLQVMLPGSNWSSDGGFELADEDCFEDVARELEAYRAGVTSMLQRNADYENRVVVDDATFQRFLKQLATLKVPKSCHGEFLVTVHWPDGRSVTRGLRLPEATWVDMPVTFASRAGAPLAVFPAVVFRDAVIKNMFHHACISKRCRFVGRNDQDLWRLRTLMVWLEFAELGRFPVTLAYQRRLFAAYARRWREPFVYAHALWLMRVRRLPVFKTEEAVLRGQF
jgi:UDP-MurNAc hydroxylase